MMWLLAGFTLLAIVGFVGGLALAGYVLLRLPEDYFAPGGAAASAVHPVRWWAVRIARNVAGIALIVTGVVLLFTPGQGVLTMLFGLALVDFPGKHALVCKLLARPGVLQAANDWRARFGKPPLRVPEVLITRY